MAAPTTELITNPLRFPGQYEDQESGLYQNFHRDYDPRIGAYATQDPIGVFQTGANRYGYVYGDPIGLVDPTGEFLPAGFVVFRVGSALIGVGFEVTSQVIINYYEGCNIWNLNNYDIWDVVVAGSISGIAPGLVGSIGKINYSRKALKILSDQIKLAKAASKIAKIQQRMSKHEGHIWEIVQTSLIWQTIKHIGKATNRYNEPKCLCNVI